MGKLWSYILPLPVESVEQLEVLLSVFSSRITVELLKNIRLEGKTYQKELLEKLPYSSKTIIQKLKQLVSADVLKEGVEPKKTKGRTVWIKWYTPTFIGKWIIMLLTPLEEIDPVELSNISKELFRIYARSLAELCLNFRMKLEDYHEILDREYLNKIPYFPREKEAVDVVVFDMATLDVNLCFDNLEDIESIDDFSIEAGGSATRIISYLNNLGVKTFFMGKVGNDKTARKILDSIIAGGSGFSCISVVDSKTPKVFALHDRSGKWKTLALGDSSLSLESPTEVDWEIIDRSKVVYLGEVRREIVELVSSYSKSKNKIVIYKPLLLFLKYRIDELAKALENIDVLILDEMALTRLGAGEKLREILGYGVKGIIKLSKEVELFLKDTSIRLLDNLEGVNLKLFGDLFSAGLIKGLLDGGDLKEAAKFGFKIALKNLLSE